MQTVFPAEGSAVAVAGALGPASLADYVDDAELAWARRHNNDGVTDFSGQLDALASADLVVGFELPPSLKRHLHGQGRPYISFHVHALRLLRDLCLGASTNCPDIARALQDLVLPASEITRQVHHHRALCLNRSLPLLKFPAGLPVLIGQTERDSVLIRDNTGRIGDVYTMYPPIFESALLSRGVTLQASLCTPLGNKRHGEEHAHCPRPRGFTARAAHSCDAAKPCEQGSEGCNCDIDNLITRQIS